MSDFIRQFFSALESRVKSNFVGFVLLAFVFFNWKPLFILLFSDYDVLVRLAHFEGFTSRRTLFWYPILFGVSTAVLSPWVNLLGAYAVRVPLRLLSEMNENEVSQRKIRLIARETDENIARAAAEVAEAQKQAASEERLIGAAKRISEIKEIPDEDVRKQVESQIADLRSSSRTETGKAGNSLELSEDEKNLLDLVSSKPEGTIRFDESGYKFKLIQGLGSSQLPSRHEFINLVRAAKNLRVKGLMDYDPNSDEYSLTAEGYDIIEEYEKNPF